MKSFKFAAMSKKTDIEAALAAFFTGDIVEVIDYAGDDDHFTVKIKSRKFENMNRVAQSRLAHQALGDLSRTVHAFQFDLTIPE